jgi:hypothetical protein
MALAELLRKADAEPDIDTLREGVRVMTQAETRGPGRVALGRKSADRQLEKTRYKLGRKSPAFSTT